MGIVPPPLSALCLYAQEICASLRKRPPVFQELGGLKLCCITSKASLWLGTSTACCKCPGTVKATSTSAGPKVKGVNSICLSPRNSSACCLWCATRPLVTKTSSRRGRSASRCQGRGLHGVHHDATRLSHGSARATLFTQLPRTRPSFSLLPRSPPSPSPPLTGPAVLISAWPQSRTACAAAERLQGFRHRLASVSCATVGWSYGIGEL